MDWGDFMYVSVFLCGLVHYAVFGYDRHSHLPQLVVVGLDEALALAGALVHQRHALALRSLQVDSHVVEVHIGDAPLAVGSQETTVLAGGGDVVEVNVADIAAAALGLALRESPVLILMIATGTWIAGDVDGLGLAPPHIAP